MKNNKIELNEIVSLLDSNPASRILTETDIRRLGGRKNDDKVEPIFKCIGEKKLYVELEELKKLLCFIVYKESFPGKTLLDISKSFNKSFKDSSIDEFMRVYIKERKKNYDQLFNILTNKSNDDIKDFFRECMETICSTRENVKKISEIKEMRNNKIGERDNNFFLNYENKIFKYLEIENINDSIYPIIDNIQKNKFSENKDLNSKLLESYKEKFVELEKFMLNQNFNTSTIQVECKPILNDFISSIKKELTKKFKEIKELKRELDCTKIINDIKPIQNKLKKLVDKNKNNRKKEGNIFFVPKNEKEDTFHCLDELTTFYSSENGKRLDKIFKNNHIILKLFNLLISNNILKEGKNVFLDELKADEIYSIEEDFKSIKLQDTIFYPGYNFYFNEHLINDIYKILRTKDFKEQEKLISYVEKIIPHIEVGLDSDLSKVYENSVYSGNPKAIKALNGHLNNFKSNDLRILTEGEYNDEIILNSIDLLKNINLKGYYKYIYNGNYKTLETLYEDNINSLNEDNYNLEMNFCLKGKNPVETSRIIFEEARKNHSNYKNFKIRFCNVAAFLNNKEILEDNLEFLKKQSSKSKDMNEFLALCLNTGKLDIFSKIYNHRQFDMYKIFIEFYTYSSKITKDSKIWKFIVNNVFKELDVNKKLNRKFIFDSLELDEEKLPSHLKNIGSPIENEYSIALFVAYNLFPKGIQNYNFYNFGEYNLSFLDKLRKESKYYKQEFQVMYDVITHNKEIIDGLLLKDKKNGTNGDITFKVGDKEFIISCEITNNCQSLNVLQLKTNSHKNVTGGLILANSMDEAQKACSEIVLKKNLKCLLAAIKNKDRKEIESILNGIIDINREDESGMFPLLFACVLGYKDIVELLLVNKAHPNKIINNGRLKGYFSLIQVAQSGNLDIAKLLIENGADVNLKLNNGCTSLMEASECGHEDIVKILIENDANINAKQDGGATALELASEVGNEKIVNLLIKNHANINVQRNDGFTPLIMAAQMGKEKIVKALLENGADPNIKSIQGGSALMLASYSGIKNITKLLIDNGADINTKANNGFTPLMTAVQMGKEKVLKTLLENGVDINAKEKNGLTSLMVAVQMGKEKIVKTLLEYGADINAKANNGFTPLMVAEERNQKEIVELLKEAHIRV